MPLSSIDRLGAVHDGSPPPSYLGGPGARGCRWEDGYIMSDLRHTEKGFRWSDCSTKQFHHFLGGAKVDQPDVGRHVIIVEIV